MTSKCRGYLDTLTYTTGKQITVRNPFVAIVHVVGLLLIAVYVVVYTIILDKGYQLRVIPTGYVLTKVKGLARNTSINMPMDKYSFFDSMDLVPFAMEMDGLFVTTAIIQTWQSRGICDGRDKCVADTNCSTDRDKIGVYTGHCVGGYCQQYRWCPPEDDTIKPANKLKEVETFTMFLKVVANFDKFGIILMNTEDKLGTGQLVPGYNLFAISDILKQCGIRIDDIEKGALITLEISFDCSFDQGESCDPYPKFSWQRQDTKEKSVSSGFNFRQAYYSLNDKQSADRLLVKYHGIRIKFTILGQGAKFDFGAFSKTLGSGIALTAIATLFAELVLKNCTKAKSFYAQKRLEVVAKEQAEDWVIRNSEKNPEQSGGSKFCCWRSNRQS